MANLQIRGQIIGKIQKVPDDKLNSINEFIDKLSTESSISPLAFASSWKDIDEKLFDELTVNLIKNREKNYRRFDE